MKAAELREALEIYDLRFAQGWKDAYRVSNMRLADAARTIALPILEADPELVERLHNVVHSWVPEFNWPAVEQMTLELLAAISTPTPGAE